MIYINHIYGKIYHNNLIFYGNPLTEEKQLIYDNKLQLIIIIFYTIKKHLDSFSVEKKDKVCDGDQKVQNKHNNYMYT